MSTATRYVSTAAIGAALKGHETNILAALGISSQPRRPHVQCPYPAHPDTHPSWRWDRKKARAYCTCIDGSHSVLDVLVCVERIDFEAAKVRAAELLGRHDLIRERREKKE